MKIIVAQTAGFCWGVRRAMDAVLKASNDSKFTSIQTIGPLIHNPQALEFIKQKGITIIDDISKAKNGAIVIRAHGIPIQKLLTLKKRQDNGELTIINATCPEVAKVQSKIKKWSPMGYFIIIIGDHNHAESIAHQSFAEHGSVIVANIEEAKMLPLDKLKKILIVAQTTFILKDFLLIADYIKRFSEECIIENTICKDTWIRQNEAKDIAKKVDYVIVIGGRTSSNTNHLAKLVSKFNTPVQCVETASEIDINKINILATVGIIAGASTPTWLVEEAVELLSKY